MARWCVGAGTYSATERIPEGAHSFFEARWTVLRRLDNNARNRRTHVPRQCRTGPDICSPRPEEVSAPTLPTSTGHPGGATCLNN